MIVTSQQLPLHRNHTLTSKKDDIQAQYSVYVDISTGKKKLNLKMQCMLAAWTTSFLQNGSTIK